MQSDELAIDHLNGLRLSSSCSNTKDIDNKNNSKQKSDSIVDDSEASTQQRHRRHKKSKKKGKKLMIYEFNKSDANSEFNAREGNYAEGKTTISRNHTEGEIHNDEEEVPHRRIKIISTPVGERRRSSRRKSHPTGVKTKLPKLPIPAGATRVKDDEDKFPVDEEDILQPGEATNGYDTESNLNLQNARSKESDVVYLQKTEGDGFFKQNKDTCSNNDGDLKTELICNDEKSSRLDFVWKMHLRFRSLGIMTNGLVAGLALSQCIFIFSFSDKNLKDDYSELAILFQSIYYLLLTISTVSVLDSYFSLDSNWADFLNHLIARPLRAVTLVSYVLSLIFSISLAQLDDSIHVEKITSKKLDTWKALNMFRVITSIIGWISVSFSPLDDITAVSLEKKRAQENERLQQGISRCEVNVTPITVLTSHEEL